MPGERAAMTDGPTARTSFQSRKVEHEESLPIPWDGASPQEELGAEPPRPKKSLKPAT